MNAKITFNRETGEFERDGKQLRATSIGVHAFCGYLRGYARSDAKLAKVLEGFANFNHQFPDGTTSCNESYFEEVK